MKSIRVCQNGQVIDEYSPNSNAYGEVVQEKRKGKPWNKFIKPHPVQEYSDQKGHTLVVLYKEQKSSGDLLDHPYYIPSRIVVYAVLRQVIHNNGWKQLGIVEIVSFNPKERPE